ncbi:hypothetical protein WN48_00217 [Eufriesea mexicana]|uniref:Uncharacterized protein n=1 Tax=Eufriesea mexicana TaxID=516756 RepID=A0A310S5I9_9HYME|nr:hypothetical protein WN48_00217 [Eufriesea mexicana]
MCVETNKPCNKRRPMLHLDKVLLIADLRQLALVFYAVSRAYTHWGVRKLERLYFKT